MALCIVQANSCPSLQLAGHKASWHTCQYFYLPIYLHLDLSISLFETSNQYTIYQYTEYRIFLSQILIKGKKIKKKMSTHDDYHFEDVSQDPNRKSDVWKFFHLDKK